MPDLGELLRRSSARHDHLCPRQVLGVRAGLAGAAVLGVEVPQTDKRLLVIVETDGCFADGVEAATGATVGHRTLRVEDYGKIAVTLIDTQLDRAYRISPRLDSRQRAWEYAPGEQRHYFAQLQAYQVMPDEVLFVIQPVALLKPLAEIISDPGIRTSCDRCGEDIINEREVYQGELRLCRACAGDGYYMTLQERSLVDNHAELIDKSR